MLEEELLKTVDVSHPACYVYERNTVLCVPKKCPRHILPAVVYLILIGIHNRFSIYENLGNLLFSFMLGSSFILVYLISPTFSKHQVILDYSCKLWTFSHYFHLVRPERE